MKKLAIILLLSLAFVPACGDDPASPPPPDNSPKLLALTSRVAVLNNIEVAWNMRNVTAYDALLDANFSFYFAPGDVGGDIPVQWGRVDEMRSASCLFTSKNGATPDCPNAPQCRSIRMDLQYDEVQWGQIIPDQFPDEIWYTTTVPYTFTFKMEPDQTYTNEGNAQAEFTVRNVGTDSDPHWQLVEFRDLGNN
jgi:hypothetical protein